MSNKPANYAGADEALNELLRFLMATQPDVMLDAASLVAEKWGEFGADLARHLFSLHAHFETENAIWKAEHPGAVT